MLTNGYGVPVIEEVIFPYGEHLSDESTRDQALTLLCQYLSLEIYRTNDTKHGYTEIKLREKPIED